MTNWIWISPLLTLLIAGVTLAYNFGVTRQHLSEHERRIDVVEIGIQKQIEVLGEIRDTRQRLVELERRIDVVEVAVQKQIDILGEIRDRVISLGARADERWKITESPAHRIKA